MRVLIALVALVATALIAGALAPAAHAEGPNAIVNDAGCLVNQLPRNDDGSTGIVPIGFPVNYFGTTNTHLFVNNNGNVTFGSPLSTFTPFALTGATGRRIIAPFFADVDTRGSGSDVVRYSFGPITFNGRPAFCVNWVNVGFYAGQYHRLNSFQLLLVDRSDVGAGDFDIVFNYDKVQWETGQASGGDGNGLGGTSAAVGFSAGTGVQGTFFQQPGSLLNGALLDTNLNSGLIHNSRNTLQLGRYIFPVRNGAAPSGGIIRGTVFGPGGTTLENALVQVCPVGGGQCAFVTATNPNGDYIASGLPPNDYTVTAFPPAGSSLSPDTEGPLNVVVGSDQTQNLVLTGPAPPPAGTTAGNSAPGTIPSVVVGRAFDIVTTGCNGGGATYTITGTYGGSVSGPMTEAPAGTYTATVTLPFTGPAHVTIQIDGCATIEFDIYIDPSGFVRTPSGAPIRGATVTLYRADSPAGPFVPVPDGSAVMSPANRSNPDLTDATGHFGWDTIAGYYKVRAEKSDCHAPGDPSQLFVETDVLPVPPPVTDIDLRLEGPGCEPSDTTPPEIDVPDDTTAEATGPDGATVEYEAAAEDGVDGPVDVSCAPASGSLFALGSTTVTCTAEDAAGNGAEESFTVNVVDTTAPALTVPADITVDATGPAGGVVSYSASAFDLVDGILAPSCSAASGDTFAIGDTSVTCSVEDAAGNRVQATFNVHVAGAAEQLADLIVASTGVGPGTSLADKARGALASVEADAIEEACGTLRAYLNELRAQTGKQVTAEDADGLRARVDQIRAVLAC